MPPKLKIEEPGAAPAPEPTTVEEVVAADAAAAEADAAVAAVEAGADVPLEIPMPFVETPGTGLPHASEIDATKIKTMTLSQEGWVLPASLETQANG